MQKLKEQFKSLEKCMLLNSNKPGQPMFKDLAVFISRNTFFTKIKVVPHVTQNPGMKEGATAATSSRTYYLPIHTAVPQRRGIV